VLFVDGRYTLQVTHEVDGALFAIEHLVESPPDQWIERNLSSDDRLAYDPWLHTVEGAERLRKACAAAGAALVPFEENLIDQIWTDRPPPPLGPVTLHDLRFAGETAEHKHERIAAELARLRADALVISDPHGAWTFNIRGADVARTPAAALVAIVRGWRSALYIDGASSRTGAGTSRDARHDVRPRMASSRRWSLGQQAHCPRRSGERRRRACQSHQNCRRHHRSGPDPVA
jgi:Xaa-Pro aminopeptidase